MSIYIWFLLIGVVAGWLASQIRRGGGFNLGGNILVGVLGSFLGGYLFAILDISTSPGLLGPLMRATVGAIILLILIGLS